MPLMLRQITWGFVVGLIAIRALAACGSTQLVECRVNALHVLPADPEQVTVYDVVDLVGRLKACKAQGDAGP